MTAATKRPYVTGWCQNDNHARCAVDVCHCDCHTAVAVETPLATVHTLHAAAPVPASAPPTLARDDEQAGTGPTAVAPATPELDLKTRATLTALATVMGDTIKDGVTELRSGVLADLLDLYRQTGAKSLVVKLPGSDQTVATITLRDNNDKAVVSDDQALLRWAKTNRPDEVVTVESVRESFTSWLLANVEKDTTTGECSLVDKATGETTRVPGLRAVAGGEPSSFGLTWKAGGKDAARQHLTAEVVGPILALDGARVIEAEQ